MPSQSKFAGLLACGAGVVGVSQVFTSMTAPTSTVSSHGVAVAQGTPSPSAPLSGSLCSVVTAISGVALAASAAKASLAVSKRQAKVRVMALAQDDEEMAFQPGQRVILLAPPAMAGKQGTVLGPDLSDTFKVQLESGSVFSIATSNINGGGAAPAAAASVASYAPAPAAAAATPAQDDDELAFQPGERVTMLAPPAMAGKQATIVGPALGDTFACQLDSGSVFNIATYNIQGAGGAPPAAAAAPVASYAPALAAASPAQDDDELAFQPGERVTILAPPAMAGKQATVVRAALGDTFACQLDSGSIFNIAQHNIQSAGGYTPAAPAVPAAAAPVASYTPPPAAPSATQSGEEPEFENGQVVQILAPPALAGNQGTIGGPALDDCWMVVLASGSVFSIKTANLKVAMAA